MLIERCFEACLLINIFKGLDDCCFVCLFMIFVLFDHLSLKSYSEFYCLFGYKRWIHITQSQQENNNERDVYEGESINERSGRRKKLFELKELRHYIDYKVYE